MYRGVLLMRKKTVYAFVCILLCFGFILMILSAMTGISQQTVENISDFKPTIVIDAGHGGEDGGASAADGTLEKDINLSISMKLSSMLQLYGFDIKNIRDTDISIYDDTADTIFNKKVSDLKNRVKIFNSSQNNIVISIHQNKFEESKYYGTQVFYSSNDDKSALLAENIKTSVVSLLQNENTRQCKKAGSEIYVLNNAEVPAVLVECGFLSNPNEAEKLKSEDYQKQIAFSICLGFLEYYYTNY